MVDLSTVQSDSEDEPEKGGQGSGVQKEKVNPDGDKEKRSYKRLPITEIIEGTGKIQQLSLLDPCGREGVQETETKKQVAAMGRRGGPRLRPYPRQR